MKLDDNNYRSTYDIPSLPPNVPPIVAKLISEMLTRSPSRRISAKQAANICQLLLWAPTPWTASSDEGYKTFYGNFEFDGCDGVSLPRERNEFHCYSTQNILQWLLTLTTKVLYEARFSKTPNEGKKKGSDDEYQLVATFLGRINLQEIKSALKWIQQNK